MYRYLSGRLRQLGISHGELARRLNLSQAAVSHRFTGKKPWSIEEMYFLLDLCGAADEELHTYFPRKGGLSA